MCVPDPEPAAMPLHGVCKNIMSARQKEHGYGTSQNPDRFKQQDYLQLKRFLLTQNKLFRDETFPPDQRSIGQGKLEPAELAQVQWLRPRVSTADLPTGSVDSVECESAQAD